MTGVAKTALVTGAAGRTEVVARALRHKGFDVLEASGPAEVARVLDGAPGRVLDVYVQLPVQVDADAATVTAQMEALLQQGILGRFRCAELALSHMGPAARVILVPGNLPPNLSAPDDREARLGLLRVLAHAMRADRAPDALSVTIASAEHPPESLALMASGTEVPHPPPPDYAEMWPEMAYDEWRLAVLDLDTLEG